MSGFHDNVLLGASGSQGYQISRSVRLRSSASAYFNRTPASAGNRKTWTWSGWVKLGSLSTTLNLMYAYSADSDSGLCQLSFQSNKLRIQGFSASFLMVSTPVYRDPSAWYHIVYKVDTTQATAADRVRVYVNGVEITAWATNTPPPQNTDTAVNNNVAHNIGRNTRNSNDYLDGYLTEINLIDGQALTPSSFGETNPITGVWQPKKYTGTYGTNGFYLNFSDNSAATAAAIGKDYSGNGNNWTPNNISVTAGVTYDSMLDVPTQWADGGNGRGNYCTLNPIGAPFANGTVTDGNLKFAGLTTTDKGVAATIAISSGTFYWESTQLTNSGSSNCYTGVITTGASSDVNANRVYVRGDGIVYKYGTSLGTVFSTFTNNDVIGLAYDRANNTLAIYKNGTLGYTVTGLNNADHTPWVGGYTTTDTWATNFGQRPFSYTPPSGFKALNTLNLPTPTILKGNQYFDATTYTGTSASNAVVNAGGFQPDLVWLKNRNYGTGTNHVLVDAVRGVSVGLASNLTNADFSTVGNFSSINSNGFTVTGTARDYNFLSDTFVGWQWKEGATQGFDIVTYTGDGVDGRTVAHNLGVAPKMVIVKSRSTATNWNVKHASLSSNNVLQLNTTDAQSTPGSGYIGDLNSSTTFTLKNGGAAITNVNGNGTTYVAYLFAEVAGFSKFGSYTGNGSSDGVFVHLGFRARYLLIKETGNANSWEVYDTARNSANVQTQRLFPNDSLAEATTDPSLDILSNGFKCRAGNTGINRSGGTYIYAAFAENPFKNALAR